MCKIYFFLNDQYLRYDVADDRVDDGYPLPIAGNWQGMAEAGFAADLDAAVNWGNGKVYFFKGNRYLRYSMIDDQVEAGYPKPIAGNWPGFDEIGWTTGVDDVVNWANGKTYFFFRDQYLRYDVFTDRVDPGYPQPISAAWKGITGTGFDTGIDAAINWGNDKAYMFKGGQYLRYDIVTDQVDNTPQITYPATTTANWPGFADAGFAGAHAVVNWF